MAMTRVTAAALAIVSSLPAAAQQPATPPGFKAIWEPVSFTEEIDFREAFFVTVDKGWVAGDQGTIIHTKDAGATWTVVMGGDPQAKEETVKLLRFVDEQHGWAVKNHLLVRTQDGESWADLGAIPGSMHEFAMSSPTEGVSAAYVGTSAGPTTLRLTAIPGAVFQSLPPFVTRFKNTNLLVAGLRMLSTMPAQLSDVRSALRDFTSPTDKPGAQAALVRLGSAAGSLHQSTKAAFQKEGTQ